MDELKMVRDVLTEERPADESTKAAARARLLGEAAPGRRPVFPRVRPGVPATRRARLGLVAGVAAAAVAVAGGVHYVQTRPLYHPEPLAGAQGPAGRFLLSAADAKQAHATTGRFWRVDETIGRTVVLRSRHQPGVRYRVELSSDRHTLSSKEPNGIHGTSGDSDAESWDDDHGVYRVRPVGARDRAAYIADGRPRPDYELSSGAYGRVGAWSGEPQRGPVDPEGGALDFSRETAEDMPADPSELRAWLLNYATRFDHERLRNPDLYLFTNASALLLDGVISDQVRASTYRILAGLKGVRPIHDVDYGGAHRGRGVAMRQVTARYGTIDWQLIIDSQTGVLEGSQAVVVKPGPKTAGLRPGDRLYFEVVRNASWNNTPQHRQEPAWVRNMPSIPD